METVIKYKGVEFEIEFKLQPFEKQTFEDPGCPAYIEEVSEMKHKETCFLEFYEADEESIDAIIFETLLER